jgi:hypothetical protein
MNVIADYLIRTLLVECDSIERSSDAHLEGKTCLLPFVGSVWGQSFIIFGGTVMI